MGEDAIVQSADGYRLGDVVTVDLWEIKAFAARFRTCQTPDVTAAGRWLAVMRHICCSSVRRASDPEFVEALERRLLTAAGGAIDRLGRIALGRTAPTSRSRSCA